MVPLCFFVSFGCLNSTVLKNLLCSLSVNRPSFPVHSILYRKTTFLKHLVENGASYDLRQSLSRDFTPITTAFGTNTLRRDVLVEENIE